MNKKHLTLNEVRQTIDLDGRKHVFSKLEDSKGVSQFIIDTVIDNGEVYCLELIPVGDGLLLLTQDNPLYFGQTTVSFSKETCEIVSTK